MKRGRQETPGASAAEIFREDVLDLFLQNSISSERLAKLAGKAQRAGAEGIEDIVEKATSSKPHRALTRLAQKGSRWPPSYKASLPGKSLHNLDQIDCALEVLLPHEIMLQMKHYTDMDVYFRNQRLALERRPDLLKLLSKHNLDADKTIIFGLWQDGTPFNSDRSHTLELWSLSLLGIPDLRVPVACWPKELQIKLQTADSYFRLLSWSMRCAYMGRMPTARHDGQPWLPADKWRKQRSKEVFGFQGIIGEFRGDWSMLKSVLSMPGWSDGTGICWKCSCCLEDLGKVGREAFWRQECFTQQEFLARQRALNKPISPFFHLPTVSIDTIKVDFLHTADLGTTSDFLGNLFYEISMYRIKGPGLSKHEVRCDALFKNYIAPFYKENKVDSRLPCLRPTMLKKENKKYSNSEQRRGKRAGLCP